MTITEATDNDLRKLIFERDKVIVKFVDESCPICKTLEPAFARLAADPVYNDIMFVRMHAKENPVSSKEVKLTGTPFFATYRKGTLRDCGIISTEEGVRDMLLRLQ